MLLGMYILTLPGICIACDCITSLVFKANIEQIICVSSAGSINKQKY